MVDQGNLKVLWPKLAGENERVARGIESYSIEAVRKWCTRRIQALEINALDY